jgi:putative peptidoglycan lipid II flippase
MAFVFGDHPSVAALLVAFRLSNLLRRVLAEGPFQSTFIPYFEGIRIKSIKDSNFFFRKLSILLLFLLIFITLIVEIGLTSLLSFCNLSKGNYEIISLMRWLFPSIIFICLYGLNVSYLHCHDSFFIPNFAPFICNCMWILGVIYMKSQNPFLAMPTIAKFIVLGFLAQWVLTLPLTIKNLSINFKDCFNFKIPKEVKMLFKSFSIGIIGVGAQQINIFIDSLFARSADLRGPIYLWYSIRLEQLAFAILGIALVTTLTPTLSRLIKANDITNAKSLFFYNYKRIFLIMILCSFAIFALGSVSINLIYGRGHFLDFARGQTTFCLWAYTLGLLPSTLVLLYSSLFFAYDDFKTPTKCSIYSIIINITLNTLFIYIFKIGIISIALSTSISSWINLIMLQKAANKIEWKIHYSYSEITSIFFPGLICLILTIFIDNFFLNKTIFSLLLLQIPTFAKNFFDQLIHFVILFTTFFGSLSSYLVIFKNNDFKKIISFFWKKQTIK